MNNRDRLGYSICLLKKGIENFKMKVQAIIPSAGSGTRLKAGISKPLMLLNNIPLFVYSVKAFEQSDLVDSVILAVQEQLVPEFEEIVKRHQLHKVKKIVAGGQTRCESVFNGLKVVDEDTSIVAIHDGARPFIKMRLIEDAIALCEAEDAVVIGVPVKPTIKRVNKETLIVEATLDREYLWEIQTPQVFKKEILLRAYKEKGGGTYTDDASLVERIGVQVKILEGEYRNIKITTKEDLIIVEAFIRSKDS